MANRTKKYLASELAKETGLSVDDSKLIVESFLDKMSDKLQDGENIELRGFGRLKVKLKESYSARNPSNDEKIIVEEQYQGVFTASNILRDRVDNSIMNR